MNYAIQETAERVVRANMTSPEAILKFCSAVAKSEAMRRTPKVEVRQ